MMSLKLSKVLEEVKALTPEEQRQLREMLDSVVAVPEPLSAEDELERRLLEVGLLSEIPPGGDLESYRRYTPVEIKGKPVSETIIEERR